jgi:hypothetical protein
MNLTETQIKLQGPDDLIAAIPYLLGFHPQRSLVTMGLKQFDVEGTFRVDLPDDLGSLETLQDVTPQLRRNECDGCILVAYGAAPLAPAARAHAARRCAAQGVTPIDRVRVADGLLFNLGCDKGCCPPEGQPVPATSPVACELALAGGVAMPDRESIAALLEPVERERRDAVALATIAALEAEADLDWPDQRAQDLHTVDHWMSSRELPGADDIACLGLALGDIDIRDYVLAGIGPTAGTGRLDLWIWVARHMEDDLVAPAATVAGFAAYRAGNGVLALEAFRRALAAQPNYSLASTLLEALQAGIPPGELGAVRRGELQIGRQGIDGRPMEGERDG